MIGKKSSLLLLLLTASVVFSVFFYCRRAERERERNVSENISLRRNAVVRAIEKVLPAVVNISTERILHNAYPGESAGHPAGTIGEFFDNFLRSQAREKSYSLGSGFVIDPSGLIVTNAHVVERATRILITLNDGKYYEAQVLAGDPLNDVALLKIKDPPADLQRIPCPDSSGLYLGETVIAVGNPFGLGSSISVGALSGEGRKFLLRDKVIFSDILQTDAIVYPGNSGGPLINIEGRVIGMNMSSYQNAPGIGFAIPLSRVADVLASWMLPERFRDCSLGIVPGYDAKGRIIIKQVRRDSPAAKASIRSGSPILELNGRKIRSLLELSRMLIRIRSNETLSLKTPEKTYVLHTVREKDLDSLPEAERKLSLRLLPLTPRLAEELSYPVSSGMIVGDLTADSPAAVRRGDLLVQLGKFAINSTGDLAMALRGLHYNDSVNAVFLTPVTIHQRRYMARKNVLLRVR